MNTRRTTLLIAIILAIGTGWLTLTYLTSLRPAPNQLRAVLVATQEIPARVHIAATMFQSEMRPAQSLEPDAISNPNQAIGTLTLVTIPAGGQITLSKVGTNVALALPVRLRPGMRAVSIAIDRVKGVSGMILPGDRVDVIAIPPVPSQGPPPKAVTILRGIRILAVGTNLEDPTATPSPEEMASATVTLEVNPKQADLLAWADANSNLRLALRSPREPIRSEPSAELTLIGNGATIGAVPMIGPPAPVIGPPADLPAPAPARAPSNSIEIIVGDVIATPGPL
jgi:pilus assembly protein CpaB